MKRSVRNGLIAGVAGAAALVCFVCSHSVEPIPAKLLLFLGGTLCVLACCLALAELVSTVFVHDKYAGLYSVCMVVVSATFSLLYFYSPEIMGYDFRVHDWLTAGMMFFVAFVLAQICSVRIFIILRRYASTFYTACFTTASTSISALLYLFGDILPDAAIFDALKLFATVSSLSFAFSLVLIEHSKRKAARNA